MNNSYNALRNITSFRNTGKSQPISGIELMVDEKNMYFAGNDNGYVMTIDCPYGTQEMANDLLAKAKGFEYQGFTAEQVILPPETELGDGITVAGVYGMVARRSFKFTPGMTSNIEAPRELEVQHEYKYSSPQQRKTERQIAEARSTFTKTAAEITLKVEGLDGKYTEVKTTLDGLTITDQSGTTRIKGSSIATGSITADKIDATNLQVDAANITGSLTIGQLPNTVAQTSQIPTMTSQLINNSGYQTAQGVTTIINGTVTTDYIYALGIEASTLRGSTVALKDANGNTVGGFTLAYTTSGDGLGMTTLVGGINISSGANVYISSAYNTRLQLDQQAAKIGPTVWATDGTVIYSSDRNVKNSIEYDLSRYRQFLLDLKPCRFKYNNGQSDRFHVGLIAQDVEQSLIDNNLDSKEFAGWCKMENLDAKGTYTYGIRYDDIVPLNTMMIQELVRRVTALEERS